MEGTPRKSIYVEQTRNTSIILKITQVSPKFTQLAQKKDDFLYEMCITYFAINIGYDHEFIILKAIEFLMEYLVENFGNKKYWMCILE